MNLSNASVFHRHGYIWVTAILFIGTLLAQWTTHTGNFSEFINAVMENWQSEALQLIWQVLGLKLLLSVGSPASKEGDHRMERKMDYLIEMMGVHTDRSSRVLKDLQQIDEECGR